MLRDIYTRANTAKDFDGTKVETSDELTVLIQQIENILTTSQGRVLGQPEFGSSLHRYLFSVGVDERFIENHIAQQIFNFTNNQNYTIQPKVQFATDGVSDTILVDIYIDGTKQISINI